MSKLLRLPVVAWIFAMCIASSSMAQISGAIVGPGTYSGPMPPIRGPQTPQGPQTCVADGTVVNGSNGQPVPRAHVTANGMGNSGGATTDAQGRWTMQNLPCGRVQFSAQKSGFNYGAYGMTGGGNRMMGKPLILADGSPAHDLKIEIMPQSVITGKVVDENGDPVQNAQVQVFASGVQEGKRQWQQRNGSQTNDLGEYRIFNLQAGKYIVCAHGGPMQINLRPAGNQMVYPESCFPGPPDDLSASTMDVVAGRESRVDFTMTPVTGVSVKGMITGAGTEAGIGLQLRKRQNNGNFGMMQPFNTRMLGNGRFEISGVTPGSYFLTANIWRAGSRMAGEIPVEVASADVEGLVLPLGTGFAVTGTVKMELKNTAPAAGPVGHAVPNANAIPLNVSLRSIDGMNGGMQVKWSDDKRSFTLSDVMAGRYRVDIYPMGQTFVKSVKLGEQDIMNQDISLQQAAGPIEIVLSDDGGVVSGTLNGDDGKPASSQVILISPSRRTIMGFANQDGKFNFPVVPPGSYKLYAWSDVQQAEYANPDWMRQFGGNGVDVTVTPGQTVQADVKLTVLP